MMLTETIDKWDRTGLLEGLDFDESIKLVQLCENEITRIGYDGANPKFRSKYALLCIARIFRNIKENHKYAVMKLPADLIDGKVCIAVNRIVAKVEKEPETDLVAYNGLDAEIEFCQRLSDQIIDSFNKDFPTQNLALYQLFINYPPVVDTSTFKTYTVIGARFAVLK